MSNLFSKGRDKMEEKEKENLKRFRAWHDNTERTFRGNWYEGEVNVEIGGSGSSDPVNHPSHYTTGKIEVIDFILDKRFNYLRGNVVKYISRAGIKGKDTELQDLEKARWYLNKEIERLGGK